MCSHEVRDSSGRTAEGMPHLYGAHLLDCHAEGEEHAGQRRRLVPLRHVLLCREASNVEAVMSVRVTFTIILELEGLATIPGQDQIMAAMSRAEFVAATSFLNGDRGGVFKLVFDEGAGPYPAGYKFEPSPNPIEKSCGTVAIRSGRVSATVLGRHSKTRPVSGFGASRRVR
jgi:hypothetical protein